MSNMKSSGFTCGTVSDILLELQNSISEMRDLIEQCASQMRQFLGFGREAHVGSLTDLIAELSSNQVRLSALNRHNERKIQTVRQTIETLQASVFQTETSRLRSREIKLVCGSIIKHIEELSADLSAAQERLGTELEAIFELAIKHDTPREAILIVKDLTDRSKQ